MVIYVATELMVLKVLTHQKLNKDHTVTHFLTATRREGGRWVGGRSGLGTEYMYFE